MAVSPERNPHHNPQESGRKNGRLITWGRVFFAGGVAMFGVATFDAVENTYPAMQQNTRRLDEMYPLPSSQELQLAQETVDGFEEKLPQLISGRQTEEILQLINQDRLQEAYQVLSTNENNQETIARDEKSDIVFVRFLLDTIGIVIGAELTLPGIFSVRSRSQNGQAAKSQNSQSA